MSDEQKKNFTKELDALLSREIKNLSPTYTSVRSLENLSNTLVKAYKDIEAKNSTTRKIVPPKRDLIWKDPRVKAQNIIKNKAKYEYKHNSTANNKNSVNREMKKLQREMKKA